MSLNREQRRILKKKLGPVAKQVVELEKRLRDLKDQLSDEEKQALEDEISKIMNSLTIMEMMALEDLIANKGLLDTK